MKEKPYHCGSITEACVVIINPVVVVQSAALLVTGGLSEGGVRIQPQHD